MRNRCGPADVARGDQVPHHTVRFVEEQVMADHQAQVRSVRGRDHAVALSQRDRHRLLHQDVQARGERLQHGVAVISVGHADDERVDDLGARPEEGIEVGERRHALCLRDPGREPRVEIDERGETHTLDPLEAPHVLRPLGSEADDADSQDFLHCGALLSPAPGCLVAPPARRPDAGSGSVLACRLRRCESRVAHGDERPLPPGSTGRRPVSAALPAIAPASTGTDIPFMKRNPPAAWEVRLRPSHRRR